MKDRPIMSVTQVLDDSTGIWANDICEFSYCVVIVEDILRRYKKRGLEEILSMLGCLEKLTKESWETIKKESLPKPTPPLQEKSDDTTNRE